MKQDTSLEIFAWSGDAFGLKQDRTNGQDISPQVVAPPQVIAPAAEAQHAIGSASRKRFYVLEPLGVWVKRGRLSSSSYLEPVVDDNSAPSPPAGAVTWPPGSAPCGTSSTATASASASATTAYAAATGATAMFTNTQDLGSPEGSLQVRSVIPRSPSPQHSGSAPSPPVPAAAASVGVPSDAPNGAAYEPSSSCGRSAAPVHVIACSLAAATTSAPDTVGPATGPPSPGAAATAAAAAKGRAGTGSGDAANMPLPDTIGAPWSDHCSAPAATAAAAAMPWTASAVAGTSQPSELPPPAPMDRRISNTSSCFRGALSGCCAAPPPPPLALAQMTPGCTSASVPFCGGPSSPKGDLPSSRHRQKPLSPAAAAAAPAAAAVESYSSLYYYPEVIDGTSVNLWYPSAPAEWSFAPVPVPAAAAASAAYSASSAVTAAAAGRCDPPMSYSFYASPQRPPFPWGQVPYPGTLPGAMLQCGPHQRPSDVLATPQRQVRLVPVRLMRPMWPLPAARTQPPPRMPATAPMPVPPATPNPTQMSTPVAMPPPLASGCQGLTSEPHLAPTFQLSQPFPSQSEQLQLSAPRPPLQSPPPPQQQLARFASTGDTFTFHGQYISTVAIAAAPEPWASWGPAQVQTGTEGGASDIYRCGGTPAAAPAPAAAAAAAPTAAPVPEDEGLLPTLSALTGGLRTLPLAPPRSLV